MRKGSPAKSWKWCPKCVSVFKHMLGRLHLPPSNRQRYLSIFLSFYFFCMATVGFAKGAVDQRHHSTITWKQRLNVSSHCSILNTCTVFIHRALSTVWGKSKDPTCLYWWLLSWGWRLCTPWRQRQPRRRITRHLDSSISSPTSRQNELLKLIPKMKFVT